MRQTFLWHHFSFISTAGGIATGVWLLMTALLALPSASPVSAGVSASSPCATPITAPATGPATVAAARSGFGSVLEAGAGPRAGCSLYMLTADQPAASPPHYACRSFCATHVWLALLTKGAPVAGPGINPTLLGTVTRTDILTGMSVQQVTYEGQPVYAYSQDEPGTTEGANLFDRFTSPPGVWYLIDPARGLPAPGNATLTKETVTVAGTARTVLAARMNSASGEQLFPVYTFSADSAGQSACQGMCAIAWPPVLTRGHAQAGDGIDSTLLSIIVRPDGSHQVTYAGRPLYLFIRDAGTPGVANGDGHAVFGGTFSLVPIK